MKKHLISRLCNLARCYWNYALSRMGSVRNSHMPLFVSVEPAAVCQLRCPECPVGQAKSAKIANASLQGTGPLPTYFEAPLPQNMPLQRTFCEGGSQTFMSMEVWERVLSEIRETAWVVQFYFQGEPLLNKDLPRMIKEAHEAGLYTIVSTNAQAMTQEMAEALVDAGLDRTIVSMDGLTEESYGSYRIGGSLEKCKEALQYLVESRKTIDKRQKMIIELQCLRLKTNEHEWAEMKRQYKALGADRLTLKTAQLYDYADGHELMPSDPKYSRYIKGNDGKYHRRKLSKGCFRVWSGCVFTTAGEVLPCCYDKAHSFSYGNIMKAPLKELFHNEKAQAFRKAAYQQTPQICQECWK